MVRIGAVQMGLSAGDPYASGLKVLEIARRAEPVDFLVFPELALTAGMEVEKQHIDYAFSVLRSDADASWEYLVIGAPQSEGNLIRNNTYLIDREGNQHVHQKTVLSPYEKRSIPGARVAPIPTQHGDIGFLQCAEMMNPATIETLVENGAQAIFALANWIHGPSDPRYPSCGAESLNHYLPPNLEHASRAGVPFIFSTSSSFDIRGEHRPVARGTRIVDRNGEVLAKTDELEDIIYADVAFGRGR